ncbi:MAG: hypothetical protein WD689_11125 [Gaiellaceae bacterium]
MQDITVQYRVPVYVHVDRNTRRVLNVVVDDEHVELDDDEADPRGIAIAEQAGWPAWEFGW